jgi:hypothetical protein
MDTLGTMRSGPDPAANTLLHAEVRALLREPWNSVLRFVDHQVYREEVVPDGTKYGVETTTMWDDKSGGTLRFVIDVFRYDGADGWTRALASTVELREPPV